MLASEEAAAPEWVGESLRGRITSASQSESGSFNVVIELTNTSDSDVLIAIQRNKAGLNAALADTSGNIRRASEVMGISNIYLGNSTDEKDPREYTTVSAKSSIVLILLFEGSGEVKSASLALSALFYQHVGDSYRLFSIGFPTVGVSEAGR